MGKIRGWFLFQKTERVSVWYSNNQYHKVVVRRHISYSTPYKWELLVDGKWGNAYTTRDMAEKHAIRYMKSHPRG